MNTKAWSVVTETLWSLKFFFVTNYLEDKDSFLSFILFLLNLDVINIEWWERDK